MTTYLERYAELAKRLVPTVGGEALHGLSPELSFDVTLEADRDEWQLLGGTRLWLAEPAVAASGANFSSITIGSGSPGWLTVVTGFMPLAATMRYGVRTGNVPGGFAAIGAGTVGLRDSRAIGTATTLAYSRQGAQVLTGVPNLAITNGTFYPFRHVIATTPRATNWVPYWESTAINQAIDLLIFGYERQAQADELDPTVV